MALFDFMLEQFGAPETAKSFRGALTSLAASPADRQAMEQQGLFAKIMNNQNLSEQQKLEQLSQASPEFAQKRMELMLQPNADLPSAVKEYQFYNQLPPKDQERFLNVKRAQQALNLGGSYGILGNDGNIQQQIPKTLPPQDLPENVAARKIAEVTAESGAKSDVAASSTLPVLEQLRAYNKGSFEMPYADTAPVRAYSRIFGSSEQQGKQTNIELLKQARTDLAAPLAKELGVNPTDKDFQASLERIFDSNASQASRDAQINALEQRILARRATRGGRVEIKGALEKTTPSDLSKMSDAQLMQLLQSLPE